MNNQSKKLIEDAIALLTQAISLDEETPAETPKSAPKKVEKATSAKKSVSATTKYTEEDLEDMSYNDLKKLCKELGIPAIGSRAEIVEKILSGDTSETEDEEVEEAPAPKKTRGKTATASKKAPAKEEVIEEDDDDEDEEDSDEESEETTLDLVKEATEDMSDEDIANLLVENGISAKGKRQALIDKLVKAIDEGIISFEDDEDEDNEEPEEEEKPAKKSSAKSKKEEEPEEDEEIEEDEEVEENPDVLKFSKKRKAAFDKRKKELIAARKSGKLKDKAIKNYVSNYYNGEVDLEDLSAEELFDHYLELISLTIDDDGEIYDSEECYSINDNVYCCGHPCEYDESTGEYTCSVCESVYSADDEE